MSLDHNSSFAMNSRPGLTRSLTHKQHPALTWAQNIELSALHVDCVTTIMLKILDGKCKMSTEGKAAMEAVYDVIKEQPGKLLDTSVHQLISTARSATSDKVLEEIYEQRLMAETMISRPEMKRFKAMLRAEKIIKQGAI